MAETFLRAAAGEAVEVASAGSNPAGKVHPKVIEVMEERGFDLREAKSEHMNDYLEKDVAVVITVCGNADQACPSFPGQMQRYHWPFDDPAHAEGTEDEVRKEFRRVRDEIERIFSAYGRGWADSRKTPASC